MITERGQQAVDLASAAKCSPKTARRWLDGETVSPPHAQLLTWAAEKLGIELVDEPETEEP